MASLKSTDEAGKAIFIAKPRGHSKNEGKQVVLEVDTCFRCCNQGTYVWLPQHTLHTCNMAVSRTVNLLPYFKVLKKNLFLKKNYIDDALYV